MPANMTPGVLVPSLAAATLFSLCALSRAQDLAPASTELYVPPAPIERPAPRYPFNAAQSGREGWVLVSFVVSEEGSVIEPMIEDSSGNEALERAALGGVQDWRYEPATRNGEPVEQSMTQVVIRFALEGAGQASRQFVSTFREIDELIAAGDFATAEPMLTDLQYAERLNLYEDAWFWWLKYRYLAAAGATDTADMIGSLRKSLGYQDMNHLPPNTFVGAAERLYMLEVRDLDLSAAIDTFEMLRDSKHAQRSQFYDQVLANLEPSYRRILDTVAQEAILEFRARIGEHGYWVHDLLRRSFSLADIQGSIELVDLRCSRGTRRYASVSAEDVWNVADTWGECGVYVKGDEGTTFLFHELPATAENTGQ